MENLNRCQRCGAALPAPGGRCPACLMRLGLSDRENDAADRGDEAELSWSNDNPVPGRNAAAALDLSVLADKYEIGEQLGQGGMGSVYRARQKSLDRWIALKVIHPQTAAQPGFSERFAREARALARLNHPNIVAVYDFGQVGPLCYFAMELVNGTNLRSLIAAKDLLPEHAFALVPQLCDALQYAHDEGVVHRDIKPENILIDARGRVKIADFGLAKLIDQPSIDGTLTGTNQVMGTMRYMAPEQMEGARQVDHRADIYSLGVVLYEMLTGELPLGQFEPPSRKVPLDQRLDGVVLRALAKEPERRYQQAEHVKTDVSSITGSPQSSTPARPAERAQPSPPPPSSPPLWPSSPVETTSDDASASPDSSSFPGWAVVIAACVGLFALFLPWTETTLQIRGSSTSERFTSSGIDYYPSALAAGCAVLAMVTAIGSSRLAHFLPRSVLLIATGISLLLVVGMVFGLDVQPAESSRYVKFFTQHGIWFDGSDSHFAFRSSSWSLVVSRSVERKTHVFIASIVGIALAGLGTVLMAQQWRTTTATDRDKARSWILEARSILFALALMAIPSLALSAAMVWIQYLRHGQWNDTTQVMIVALFLHGAHLLIAVPLLLLAAVRLADCRSRWLACGTLAAFWIPTGPMSVVAVPLAIWGWCLLRRSELRKEFDSKVIDGPSVERALKIAGVGSTVIIGLLALIAAIYYLLGLVVIGMEIHRGTIEVPAWLVADVAFALLAVVVWLFVTLLRGCFDLIATQVTITAFVVASICCVAFPPWGVWVWDLLIQRTASGARVYRVYRLRNKRTGPGIDAENSGAEYRDTLRFNMSSKSIWGALVLCGSIVLLVFSTMKSESPRRGSSKSMVRGPATLSGETIDHSVPEFFRLAERGDFGTIRRMLDIGQHSVNDKDPQGRTAVMIAAANGHVSMVVSLALMGGSLAERDVLGRNALMHAAEFDRADVIRALLDVEDETLKLQALAEKRPVSQDEVSATLIRLGVDASLARNLGTAIPRLAVDTDAQESRGMTVLMLALKSRSLAAAKEILRRPLKPDLVDIDGRNALHHAVASRLFESKSIVNDTDFARHPLLQPKMLGHADKNVRTPWAMAQDMGHTQTAERIAAHVRGEIAGYDELVQLGVPEIAGVLRDRGLLYYAIQRVAESEADLQAARKLASPVGRVRWAIETGNIALLKFWLESSKEIDLRRPLTDGNSWMTCAVDSPDPRILALLAALGADPSQPDSAGRTPAAMAQQTGRSQAVTMLERVQAILESTVDPDERRRQLLQLVGS